MQRITPQRHEFTATGTGPIIEVGDAARNYSIQVAGDPVAANAWGVDLEGSLDGKNFETILTHVTGTGNGGIIFSADKVYPALFIRSNVGTLTLGSALKIIVTILGTP